ncbi:MAG: InlB B-repeat-containing protein [Treponema sp.]|nr:InlB B-repeat-containing protein [Treponema sp.]
MVWGKSHSFFWAGILFFLICSVLFSCENFIDEEEAKTEWYVALPTGNGESSATDWQTSDVVKYVVTLSQNGTEVLSKEGYPGERVTLNQLAPGVYDVFVEAFNKDDEVIADGGGQVNLETGKMANISITLTMKKNRHTYSLSYSANSNDESITGVIPTSKQYDYREEVPIEFPDITRTGYYFDGWNTAPDGSGDSYRKSDGEPKITISTSEITLYAQWVAYNYTVVFDKVAPLATGEMEAMQFTYDREQALLPCLFKRTGYVFVGWAFSGEPEGNETNLPAIDFEDRASVINLTTQQNGTVTLSAKWIARSDVVYTVEHYKQNLTGDTISDYTIVSEDTEQKTGIALMPSEAEAKNYVGFTAKTFDQLSLNPNGSTVVKIYYDRNLYKITYVAGGEAVSSLPSEENYRYQTEVFVYENAPTRTDYTFYGYKREDDGKIYQAGERLEESIDHNITLTAQWGQVGGISVEIEELQDIALSSLRNGNTVTLTAANGFSDYIWQIEETTLPSALVPWAAVSGTGGTILQLDTSSWQPGIYEVLLVANDSAGVIHSASVQVIKQ